MLAPTLPVLAPLAGAGRPLTTGDGFGLDKPFGSGAFDFDWTWALNQPAKSGSPPSSNGVGEVIAGVVGESKKESSPISPQASSSSSSSACASPKNWSVVVRISVGGTGLLRAFLCKLDSELVFGRAGSVLGFGGADEDRGSRAVCEAVGLGFASISPLAVDILFVKEEIAQPAQDVSFCGVPILGVVPFVVAVFGRGRTVSGSVVPYFRIRLRYKSKVLLA